MFVAHMSKFKSNDVKGIEIHNERKSEHSANKDIDYSKTHLNMELETTFDKNLTFKKRIESIMSQNYSAGKTIRKDATVLCSCVVTADSDFFKKYSPEQQVIFFKLANAWLKKHYPHTISSIVHFDEKTPHLHYTFVPLTEDGRLSAKEVINRNALNDLQERLPKFLISKGFAPLVRGEKGSKRRHMPINEYKMHTAYHTRAFQSFKSDSDKAFENQKTLSSLLKNSNIKAEKLNEKNKPLRRFSTFLDR